ncbi:MAG: DUF1178 family protein [Bradyrhizobiaceae bacterium]|nr:DUF1178 family protein [Hyphomicrobiales bacterium]MBV9427707.1 DUF1178 family protein [Bradyrhizobiaceae bacterium]
MIRYALCCEAGHTFESWFNNSAAFDRQAARGLVACPLCGSAKVEKSIMAPALGGGGEPSASAAAPAAEPEKTPVAIVSKEEVEVRKKLKELRDHIVKDADYVGEKFPEEARRMHYGEIEHRSIYGEASPDAARTLADEGIEFHPLPRLPDERN